MSDGDNSCGRVRVTVVGSLNLDRVWRVDTLPSAGQTILARETRTEFGGKGANQAVAAARQGALVQMIGAVGDDEDGVRYMNHLRSEGIDVSSVSVRGGASTGAAHVYVDKAGENCIVVAPGANASLDIRAVTEALAKPAWCADVLLAQLECPWDAVEQALTIAASRGVRTVLNASPAASGFSWAPLVVDAVIVNEHECSDLFGQNPAQLTKLSDPGRGAFLEEIHATHLVVTRGAASTLMVSAARLLSVQAYRVEPLDTVGAGDTFAGTLAARLGSGAAWEEALWHANVAAALSTLGAGAQRAMPSRARVEEASGVSQLLNPVRTGAHGRGSMPEK